MTFSLVTLAILIGTGVVMRAQQPEASWLGTWKLNVAKSTYAPASAAPKSQTTVQTQTPAGVKVVTDGVDAQGKPTHTEITWQMDGKDHVLAGAADANSTRVYTRVDARNYQFVNKVNGKITTTSKVAFSADGKTRTITTTGMNAQGQAVNNVAFYDKQ